MTTFISSHNIGYGVTKRKMLRVKTDPLSKCFTLLVLMSLPIIGYTQQKNSIHLSLNPVFDGLRIGLGYTYKKRIGLYMYHTVRQTQEQLSKQYGSPFNFTGGNHSIETNINEYRVSIETRYYFFNHRNTQPFFYFGKEKREIHFDSKNENDIRNTELKNKRLHALNKGYMFGTGLYMESTSGMFFCGQLGMYLSRGQGSGMNKIRTNRRMGLQMAPYSENPKIQIKLEIGFTIH